MTHKSPQTETSRTRDARMVKTDSALRRALLTMLERKQFEHVTIRDISAEAGIHYTTFFRHHRSKEALLDHVAADQIDRLVELTVPVQDAVNTRAAFIALCTYVNDNRSLWTTLLTGGAAATMRGELLRVSWNLARHRHREVEWIPEELSAICSVTVIFETLAWWLRQPMDRFTVEAMAEMLDVMTSATATSKQSSGRKPAGLASFGG